jgi:hypothetical protein
LVGETENKSVFETVLEWIYVISNEERQEDISFSSLMLWDMNQMLSKKYKLNTTQNKTSKCRLQCKYMEV